MPLCPAFLEYLRADGIVLPTDDSHLPDTSTDNGWDNDTNSQPDDNPALAFASTHAEIQKAITELGGVVAPKLNWSAPKDATWIMMKKNSMECASTSDLYLLLKSSDFITHDLEHAFDDCAPDTNIEVADIKYVLVLRKWFKVNPACEFRCFVRKRQLIGISQRDLNHFDFLFPLIPRLRLAIQEFFNKTLQDSFPDENFVFDIYLPAPHDRPRLMDINPWAPRTDPLLFSWLELLTMPTPPPLLGIPDSTPPTVSLPSSDEDDEDEEVDNVWQPELRLVNKDDPEAYAFSTPQYSAHKLPKDVVEAGMSGEGGMREFADNWKRMMDEGIPAVPGQADSDSE